MIKAICDPLVQLLEAVRIAPVLLVLSRSVNNNNLNATFISLHEPFYSGHDCLSVVQVPSLGISLGFWKYRFVALHLNFVQHFLSSLDACLLLLYRFEFFNFGLILRWIHQLGVKISVSRSIGCLLKLNLRLRKQVKLVILVLAYRRLPWLEQELTALFLWFIGLSCLQLLKLGFNHRVVIPFKWVDWRLTGLLFNCDLRVIWVLVDDGRLTLMG